jgi:hypothetical protein
MNMVFNVSTSINLFCTWYMLEEIANMTSLHSRNLKNSHL